MILNIRVVPKSSRAFVRQGTAGFKVYLTKARQGGQANSQLIELLAGYLHKKRYQIKIVKGEKSRDKLIEIDDETGPT